MRLMPIFHWMAIVLMILGLAGCQSAYYSTMEKFGVEKRDILVKRVDKVQSAQRDASEQFESALEQFSAITQFNGGDLQKQYELLKSEFEKSEDRAEAVRSRIGDVQQVAKALFSEWRAEMDQYSDANFRRQGEAQLKQAEGRYDQLMSVMQQAESRIDPVLNAFRDRVLYLKHNLNARALTSLQSDVDTVKSDVSLLIEDMKKSIKEADAFIVDFNG